MKKKFASAFAPASVANVAVGFDLLGFAVDIAGDKAHVELTSDGLVSVGQVSGMLKSLPKDPKKNTATAGLLRLKSDLGLKQGFRVSIEKGIPLGSGLGGSAASSVAAIVAANSLLDQPLELSELSKYALIGEHAASGGYHADNIAPSLFGGFTLAVCENEPSDFVPNVSVSRLPVPKGLWCVLIHPEVQVETKTARKILKKTVSFQTHIQQSANLARFLVSLYENNIQSLRTCAEDLIVEKQRQHLIPGFEILKATAILNGALCCSISGAGPTVFALAQSKNDAKRIETEMANVAKRLKIKAATWSLKIPCSGARVLK